jgi:urease accessory protein
MLPLSPWEHVPCYAGRGESGAVPRVLDLADISSSGVTTALESAARQTPMDVLLSGPQSHDGLVRVSFVRRGDRTDLARLLQRGSLRIFRPNPPCGDLPNAVLLNTSGGIVGGDRLAVRVRIEPGAAALITSQAAEKAYRSVGPDATVEVDLDLADRAWLEWLPQETILFDGARLRRCLSVAAASEARLLAADMLVFGRPARGERFRRGVLHDRIEIRVGDRLVWADALRLAPEPGALFEAPFGLAGAAALATYFYLARDAQEHIATARTLADAPDVRSGATCIGPVLVVRWLADDPAPVRHALRRFHACFRHALAGLPAQVPAIWRT